MKDVPARPTLRPNRHYFIPNSILLNMAQSTHNARIELAIADLANQTKPNYLVTAKRYGVTYITLRDPFLGQSLSNQTAALKYR